MHTLNPYLESKTDAVLEYAIHKIHHQMQMSMSAFQMEDWGRANKPAQTPLDHSTAAASLDTLYLGMLAMVSN